VIDTGYRGPLFIGYKNVSGDEVHIPAGTKLAQLVLMSNVADAMNVQQVMMDKIAESERGTDGFGSTGH
jgi:dUTPase